jgi:hypothetical protein
LRSGSACYRTEAERGSQWLSETAEVASEAAAFRRVSPQRLILSRLCDYLCVDTAEYLIRPASHDCQLLFPAAALAEVLIPPGYGLQPAEGSGDLHLQTAGYEISFSGEDPGWQVSIEGEIAHLDTDVLVAQVARQIEDYTGIAPEWYRLS